MAVAGRTRLWIYVSCRTCHAVLPVAIDAAPTLGPAGEVRVTADRACLAWAQIFTDAHRGPFHAHT